MSDPLISNPGQGETWKVREDIYICRVPSDVTGGSYSLVEIHAAPNSGPPPHIHHREDETFIILEGTFEVFFEGQVQIVEKGTVLHLPKGRPHTFRNPGPGTGKMLVLLTPGGMEGMFRDFHNLPDDKQSDIESIREICTRYAIDLILPIQ